MPAKGSDKKLSAPAIDAARRTARETGKRVAVWDGGDGGVKGFGVRVTPEGSARYVLRYRHRGHVGSQRELTLGEYPTVPPMTARIAASTARAAVIAGADPARDRAALRHAETVNDAFPRWLATQQERLKLATVTEYRRQWETEIQPSLGSMPVADVAESDLQRIHSAMSGRKVMANRVLSRLATFFRWCERAGLRPRNSNPADFVDRYPESEKERYLQDDEIKRLAQSLNKALTEGLAPAPQLKAKKRGTVVARKTRADEMRAWRAAQKGIAVQDLPPKRSYTRQKPQPSGWQRNAEKPAARRKANPRAVDAVWVLLITGWREQEALSLRWDALDLERGMVNLADTKTGKSARPVAQAALEIIKRQPRVIGNPHVFPGAKAGASLKEIRHLWYAVRHDAGLGAVRLHDLRHSFASKLVSSGSSLPMIGAALGHKDIKSTARYAKLFPEEVQKAQERAAQEILAVASGQETRVTPLRQR